MPIIVNFLMRLLSLLLKWCHPTEYCLVFKVNCVGGSILCLLMLEKFYQLGLSGCVAKFMDG